MVVEGAGGEVVSWGASFSGDGGSNNVEEYRGLLAGLLDVKERRHSLFDLIVVVGDSRLIIDQMQGKCNVGKKLCHLHKQAMDTLVGMKAIFRWIPREINEAADAMTHVARENKDLFDPCMGKSEEEWKRILKPLFLGFNGFIEIVGKTQNDHDCMSEAWQLARYNAHGKMIRAFGLMKGDRSYYSLSIGNSIYETVNDGITSTIHTGEEGKSRWNRVDGTIIGRKINDVQDMNDIAVATTSQLQKLKWNLPSLIRNLRNEDVQRPNPNLNPEVYMECLTGYPELNKIVEIARDGVEVMMKPNFRAPRPWKPNFVRNEESIQLVIKEFQKLFNAGRGILLEAQVVGKKIGSIVVSPVGAVPKGGKPMTEALRVIGGLSTPGERSINKSTDMQIPDAKFGKILEIADRILELRWNNPVGTEILALNADIDSAFYQIPVAAGSVGLFALVIPGTNLMWIPFALTFGWMGSPGFFAVFVKGVRWFQRNGGSMVGKVWKAFHCFIWVDDIVIIEPNLGDRLVLAEQRLREGVDIVFGSVGWKKEKFQTWTSKWESLGLIWNTKTCTVEMTKSKLLGAAEILEEIEFMESIPLKAVQSILGKLRHLSSCVPVAKAFVQRLQVLVNDAVRNEEDWIFNFKLCRQDIQFWIKHLKEVDFSAWPLEAFGTSGTASAVWTCGVLNHRPMVYWNGKECSLLFEGRPNVTLEGYIWLVWRATWKWMDMIRQMGIRVPLIILLVPSVAWAEAINKGNAVRLGAQEALRALASLQMRQRIWFKAVSWGKWGNAVPSRWSRYVRRSNNTNGLQIERSLENWMNLQICSLCRRCATRLDRHTRAAGDLGLSVQWPLEDQYGYTIYQKTGRPWLLSDTFHINSKSRKIHGPQSRDIFQQCDGCTERTITWNWSKTTPCSPWWVVDASDGGRSLNHGNL